MNPSSFNPRNRHPLYIALVVMVSGCLVAAVLSFLGSFEMQRQWHEVLATAIGICSKFPATPEGSICTSLTQGTELLRERGSLMLVLQSLCLVLIVSGLGAVVRGARHVLGQPRIDSAGRGPGNLHDSNEALQALRHAGHLLCDGPVSETALLQALGNLEKALGATTVALRLTEDVRQLLRTGPLLCSRNAPAIATQRISEPARIDRGVRLVPPSDSMPCHSMLVPVRSEGESLALLLVEFSSSARVTDTQSGLAEGFASLAALAISSVCRSQEARRVALMEERSAIAGELHDSLAQSLAFMKIQVAQLQRALDREHISEDVVKATQDLRGGLSAAYREVRELIAAFRVQMGPGGLAASVQETIDEFGQRSGLEIRFEHELDKCPLEVNEEFHVMQVIREALSNTIRHAGATQAWVSARYGPGHLFTVIVGDDGRGLSQASSDHSHYGLSIMRERARSLGGDIVIEPRPEGGTQVMLSFAPLRVPINPCKEAA